MKKPKAPKGIDPGEHARMRELVRMCAVSRDIRRDYCMTLRAWYMRGAQDGQRSRYNKIYSHINRVSSFIFSPGSVRFGVHLPPDVRKMWLEPATIARDEFRESWEGAGCDLEIDTALEWALVYSAKILKVQPHPVQGFRVGQIDPWDFGVSREDVADMDQQDTLAHWYALSIPQVSRWLHGETNREELLAEIQRHARLRRTGATRQQLVVSQITGVFPGGNIAGGFPGDSGAYDTRLDPEVDEPTVEFVDVWERRMFRRPVSQFSDQAEYFEDWLVTTCIADTQEPIAQRRNPDLPDTRTGARASLPGECPFVPLTPRPLPDFFWGRTELENLTGLQEWLGDHLTDLRSIVRRQLNPSKFFVGVSDAEEASRAMDTDGGAYSSTDPTAKMDKILPELKPEALKLTDMIGSMFDDTGGVPGSIAEPAQMPGGVRATGHFSMAAGIGAGRMRKQALVIESTLGAVATKAFHIQQRHSATAYRRKDGTPFLLGQIPYSIAIRVDSHTAAPIFAEQTQQKAMVLQKAGAIGPEDFVEMMDPPNRDELKQKAAVIAENKAALSKEMLEIQHEKATRTGRRAPALK